MLDQAIHSQSRETTQVVDTDLENDKRAQLLLDKGSHIINELKRVGKTTPKDIDVTFSEPFPGYAKERMRLVEDVPKDHENGSEEVNLTLQQENLELDRPDKFSSLFTISYSQDGFKVKVEPFGEELYPSIRETAVLGHFEQALVNAEAMLH